MTPRFREGDRVRVRREFPRAGGRRVHIRTPYYLRGHTGVVAQVLGTYGDPEKLAFGKPGYPHRALYQVRFAHRDVWPGGPRDRDTIVADIFEHWLEPATGERTHG